MFFNVNLRLIFIFETKNRLNCICHQLSLCNLTEHNFKVNSHFQSIITDNILDLRKDEDDMRIRQKRSANIELDFFLYIQNAIQ